MKTLRIALVVAALAVNSTAVLGVSHTAGAKPAAASASMTEGEIRKVDKDTKKLTIKHGPIQTLDMPGMTMVFQVRDSRVLDEVKPGDKIKFAAEKQGGAYVVTHIEAVK